MRAAASGQLGAVRHLIAEGADINSRGPRGATALMFAASAGHLDIVRELVEQGAEIDVVEAGGWSAKRHAEEDGYQDVVAFLEDIEEAIRPRWARA